MSGKSTQHQNSLTFQKGANQYRQVSVIFDQRFHLISLWLKSLGVVDDNDFFFSLRMLKDCGSHPRAIANMP